VLKMEIKHGWELRDKPIDKSQIRYEEIDDNIRDIIHELNKIPFLATTLSCEGHMMYLNRDGVLKTTNRYTRTHSDMPMKRREYFYAEGAILFEVYDEEQWMELVDFILAHTFSLKIVVRKRFGWSPNSGCIYSDWDINWAFSAKERKDVINLLKLTWDMLLTKVKYWNSGIR